MLVKMCANMLAESCFDLQKNLAELKKTIESFSFGPCCLSGSGSAMFCIIESGDEDETIEPIRVLAERFRCKSIIARNSRW